MPTYTLIADYFQFYLQDEASDGDLSDAWTEDAVARLLAVAPGVVGIGTVRNLSVPVSVEVTERDEPLNLDGWDHVVECSLIVASGCIVIAGCTDYFPDAARIGLPNGIYRLRACYANLDSLSDDGLNGQDRYDIQLWLASAIEPNVLKQWLPEGGLR